jgi:two-component system invasion response regulator UvrY
MSSLKIAKDSLKYPLYCCSLDVHLRLTGKCLVPSVYGDLSVIRILVADDNPAVRRYLRGLLEQKENWKVCDEARDGKDAIELFRSKHHDLVVVDFQMPLVNGLEVAREIVKLSPETPILMVTLYLSRQLEEEARRIGIRGACAKTDVGSLVEAVDALLRHQSYFSVN